MNDQPPRDQPKQTQPADNRPDNDQPPPGWYTDPEDSSQYRYWDGSAWTEHRAPRYTESDDLNTPGELLRDAFSILLRQWRVCAVIALVNFSGYIIGLGPTAISGASSWSLFPETDTAETADTDTPETDTSDITLKNLALQMMAALIEAHPGMSNGQHYADSMKDELSLEKLAPLAMSLLISWIVSNLAVAATAFTVISGLHGKTTNSTKVLLQAFQRIPRLLSLDIQILVIMSAVLVTVIAAIIVAIGPFPLLALIAALVLIALMIPFSAIVSLAYIAGSLGPSASPLLYAACLMRRKFWAALGRSLVIIIVMLFVSLTLSVPLTTLENTPRMQEIAIAATVSIVLVINGAAFTLLYTDLHSKSGIGYESSNTHDQSSDASPYLTQSDTRN